MLRNRKSRASAKPGFFPVMPGNSCHARSRAFFRTRYHRGVSHSRAWIRRGLAARRIPAFGLAILNMLRNRKSRASAKPGFFPVMPGNKLPRAKPGFFSHPVPPRRFSSRVDPSRSGSAKNPGFRPGDSEHASQPKKPGFGKARLLPGHARQQLPRAKPGFFSHPVPPRRFSIARGSVAVWQREESRLSAWRF